MLSGIIFGAPNRPNDAKNGSPDLIFMIFDDFWHLQATFFMILADFEWILDETSDTFYRSCILSAGRWLRQCARHLALFVNQWAPICMVLGVRTSIENLQAAECNQLQRTPSSKIGGGGARAARRIRIHVFNPNF